MAGAVTDTSMQPPAYSQTFPYSDKRLFAPPRVTIPPPDLDIHDGRLCFHVPFTPFEQISNTYGSPGFLNTLTAGHKLEMDHVMASWNYEMRRTAQCILPFLLLGPSSVARDADFVRAKGISLMVSVRRSGAVQSRPKFLDPATFPTSTGLATLKLDFDTLNDFIPNLRAVVRAINDHLEASSSKTPVEEVSDIRARVLIFCESGNDRSPVLAAAYLMAVFGIDAFSAIHIVQSQRYCITISDEMKHMLLDLQQIISAERQVSSSNAASTQTNVQLRRRPSPSALSQQSGKRGIEHLYASDEAMGDVLRQRDRAEIREGIAPFADVAD